MENEKINTSRYIVRPTITTWISIVLTLSIIPLSIILPDWWSWENGPIEWTQVVILGLSLAFSLLMAWNSNNDDQFDKLWAWSVIAWLLLIGRELSWGRVFYPTSNGFAEPTFLSLKQLWYGQYVNPIIAILLITMIVGIWRTKTCILFLKTMPISIIDFVIILTTAFLSIAYDKNIVSIFAQHREAIEEMSELSMYWAMFSTISIIGQNQHKIISSQSVNCQIKKT